MSFELRKAKVGLLILEGQGVIEHQGIVRMFWDDKSASHRELGPSTVFHLIEIVFSVEDELLEIAVEVFDRRNEGVARKNSSDVEVGVIQETVAAKYFGWNEGYDRLYVYGLKSSKIDSIWKKW